MKIRFLGTNHGMEDSKTNKNRQCILIESAGRSYIFDAGAPVAEILEKEDYDLSRIKGIFISHRHTDHLLYLAQLCENKSINAKIYLPDDEQMARYSKEYDRRFFKICEGNFYNDLFMKVSSVKTKHLIDWEGNSICHGFLVEAEGKRVHITSDMTPELIDFPKYLEKGEAVDMIVSECAHPEISGLFEKFDSCNAERIAVIHVYPEERYDELNSRMGKNSFELLLPADGDEFII
ncbi:MAG: MBL fold metallo-hydrolase [Ruminococcaceae bacterium]|nr:MBL fold metallo-hydrolase [Oscillospiraceae bacterium]